MATGGTTVDAGAAANTHPTVDACSIADSLGIVGDRWTILILRDAFRGLRRFDEFRRDLDIPRAVLADRLRRLVEHGVMAKRVYQDRPVRHEYRLTRMGLELSPILVALMQWGDRWLSEDGPPTLLVHETCDTEIEVGLRCVRCNRDVAPTEVSSHPGHLSAPSTERPPATEPPTEERSG